MYSIISCSWFYFYFSYLCIHTFVLHILWLNIIIKFALILKTIYYLIWIFKGWWSIWPYPWTPWLGTPNPFTGCFTVEFRIIYYIMHYYPQISIIFLCRISKTVEPIQKFYVDVYILDEKKTKAAEKAKKLKCALELDFKINFRILLFHKIK